MASRAKIYHVQIAITNSKDCIFLKSIRKSDLLDILGGDCELPMPEQKCKPGAYIANLHVLSIQTTGWGGEPAEWDLRLTLTNLKAL